MDGKNTSQDPDYFGPTGHEKKFHKTHFHVMRTLKKTGDGSLVWVEVGPGRYKGIPREEYYGTTKRNS
jgi:ribosomal protein L21E